MKNRVISTLLAAVMLLSAFAGLAGCSPGSSSDKGSTIIDFIENTGKKVGNAKRDGVEVVMQKLEGVSISPTEGITADDGATLLSDPVVLSAENIEGALGESVIVRFKLPKDISEDDYVTLMGAYYDGNEWEYIHPDFAELEKGYLTFSTPHFSTYASLKLDKEKAMEKYAETLAVQKLMGEQPSGELADCFTETLDKIGFTDKTAQGIIVQKIFKENDYLAFITNAKNGDIGDISGQGAELIANALLKSANSKEFVKKAKEAAGSISSGAFAAAMELMEGGSASDAYKEFVYSAMDYFPAARAGKAVVEATKAGAEMWQDYSIASAYRVYLDQYVSSDGSISSDSWDIVFYNMGSGLDFLKREYRTAYAANHGMTVKELEADKTLRARLDGLVEDDIRKKFMTRYTNTAAVETEKAEIMKMLRLFDEHGLLDPDSFLKFSTDMSLTDRINSLIKIRQNIIDLVGGDLSVFGVKSEIEDNLAFAVKMWLLCGKDRAKFYDWMRENGYLEKLGKPDMGGYWELVRSFENDYEKSKADDAYTESWSGGSGSYTYNCKTTFDYSYTGSTHDNCKGEFVNNTGTASAPSSRYAGGEQVKLTLTVSAATSSNICFHLGAHLTSCITPVNHDDPFISYGTETYMQNVDDENARGDVRTYKNDTNTGYIGGSVTTGAIMPAGYEDGDKVYILIIFTGGNNMIKTAYEYEWHS